MRRNITKTRGLSVGLGLTVAGLLSGGICAAEIECEFSVTRGSAMLKRGQEVSKLAQTASRSLRVGDRVTTGANSSARICLGGKNVIVMEEKTSVVLSKLRFLLEKPLLEIRTVSVGLSLEAGTLKPFIYEPEKPKKKKREARRAFAYDLQVIIGEGVVRGPSFVGKIVRHSRKKYTVDVYEGRPVLRRGKVVIRLGSAVTVDEGPPFTVVADPANETPVVAAGVGSVVFVLQPGQSVSIEVTETGVRITNLSPNLPLHVCAWGGVPLSIEPGGSADFAIVEQDVSHTRALSHIRRVTGLISDAFPEAFPPTGPPPSEVPVEIIELPGQPREDQGGVESNEQ